jgi:hypothetical protein
MKKPSKAVEFLQNMTQDLVSNEPPPVNDTRTNETGRRPASTRTGLKHIGGYLDTETVEKVAILRARLCLDNSALIKLAVDDLHRKHMAKRAFGDA